VVNEELADRIGKIAEKEGRRPGATERKRWKEEVISDLLPRAFIRPSRLNAYLDAKEGWLVIDSASRKAAEDAVSQLREALGRFPATPMAPEESPRALMTNWLTGGRLPDGLVLGDECELRDPVEAGAVVRCRRQDLESDEVREHLKSGKQVFQLGLVYEDRMSFVLGEDLVVRKFRFLDVVLDSLGEETAESAQAELDASFALMTLELKSLFGRLEKWFGIPRPGERD
jgi:recombination associated protein RdgC